MNACFATARWAASRRAHTPRNLLRRWGPRNSGDRAIPGVAPRSLRNSRNSQSPESPSCFSARTPALRGARRRRAPRPTVPQFSGRGAAGVAGGSPRGRGALDPNTRREKKIVPLNTRGGRGVRAPAAGRAGGFRPERAQRAPLTPQGTCGGAGDQGTAVIGQFPAFRAGVGGARRGDAKVGVRTLAQGELGGRKWPPRASASPARPAGNLRRRWGPGSSGDRSVPSVARRNSRNPQSRAPHPRPPSPPPRLQPPEGCGCGVGAGARVCCATWHATSEQGRRPWSGGAWGCRYGWGRGARARLH